MTKPKQVNIAFLMGRLSDQGGISRVTSIISNELYQSGYESVHVISYHKREVSGYQWNKNIYYHDLLSNRLPMYKGLIKAAAVLRNYIKKNNIDVIIICGHNVGLLAVLATGLTKTKLIYWSHNSFKGDKAPFKPLNERFNSAFSNAVVSLTKTDQKTYKEKTLARKVEQIYNPIAPELAAGNTIYNPDTKKIISVGRLAYQKNFELLVDVAKIVLTEHDDYTWHIYGSGSHRDAINKKIIENQLEGRVVLMGQASNIYKIYPGYSILVMTSRYEGFPMSLLEGMASKLPLVSFDIATGPNEIIRENVNGFLIEPFHIDNMADKICTLIKNRNLRVNFSEQNKQFIHEFNIDHILRKWVSLIEEICHSR